MFLKIPLVMFKSQLLIGFLRLAELESMKAPCHLHTTTSDVRQISRT